MKVQSHQIAYKRSEEIFLKLKTLPGLMNNKHNIDTHQSLTPQGLQDKT
jgi:hypothetical protein